MAKYHIQNSIWWTEYHGLSGIRMDTFPYPDKNILSEWNRKMLEECPDINIVGEEWSTNPVIVSYWQGGWQGDKNNAFTGKGMTDTQTDMQNYFKKLLHYRKENEVLQTGQLMHFAPDNGVYVYFRYNEDKIVMLVLNKNKSITSLDMNRFQEIVPEKSNAMDILSCKKVSIEKRLEICKNNLGN